MLSLRKLFQSESAVLKICSWMGQLRQTGSSGCSGSTSGFWWWHSEKIEIPDFGDVTLKKLNGIWWWYPEKIENTGFWWVIL